MYAERIRSALPELRERMSRAADRVGRDVGSVRLIAVTKAHPIEAAEAAIECGLFELGENRPEELAWKTEALTDERVVWHMIGSVQRRKVPSLVGKAALVHSVDSLRLGERFSRVAVDRGVEFDVLVQVNVAGEEQKHGVEGPGLEDEVLEIAALPGVHVRGLMTMAPYVAEEGILRTTFGGLRRVHESLSAQDGYCGTELSMGMTNDFEIAIEEGSTMIRVGTALLGPRPPKE